MPLHRIQEFVSKIFDVSSVMCFLFSSHSQKDRETAQASLILLSNTMDLVVTQLTRLLLKSIHNFHLCYLLGNAKTPRVLLLVLYSKTNPSTIDKTGL